MDKKTVTALVIIGAIVVGFTWYNSKQAEKFQQQKAVQDSIALATQRLNAEPETAAITTPGAIDSQGMAIPGAAFPADQNTAGDRQMSADSVRALQFGASLSGAMKGEENLSVLENDVMRVTLSTLGGKVSAVELKDYKSYDGQPIQIYAPGSAEFDLSFYIMKEFSNAQINTSNFYFEQGPVSESTDANGVRTQSLALYLPVDSTSRVEFVYTLREGDYMVDFNVNFTGMAPHMANQSNMDITWKSIGRQNEKGYENENNYTTIDYKYPREDGLESLGMSKGSKQENISSSVQWVAFKQQFFSSILIAGNSAANTSSGTTTGNTTTGNSAAYDFANAVVRYDTEPEGSGNVKAFSASLAVPFNRQVESYGFRFYFGPNKYSILKKYDLGIERLVPLGKGLIRWVNRVLIVPVFDFLGKWFTSYGLIILLLTIFIKIIIFPLTYKSYLSTAKMRLIKPEVDALAEKYPRQEDAMKKQQATMELYKKAGISPMGGCLPLLIQFPILIAMFRFFPASIELRGESFLWADDLSSYDSVLNLPFNIPFYGDHVSLFTLLMAVAMHISARVTTAQQGASTAPGMGGMKFMTLWLMPIMLLLWFNNYSSGLSYYYLLSTLITVGQTYLVRSFVDDDKLHARMRATAAKAPKKQSKWQQRYQEMMKAQQQQAQQQRKKR